MNKKLIIPFLLVTSIISVSCANKAQVSANKMKGKIIVWTQPQQKNAINLAANNYKKINSGVQIDIKEVNEKSLMSNMNSSVTTNKGIPDLVIVSNKKFDEFTNKYLNKVMNINDTVGPIHDSFLKNQIDVVLKQGDYLAVPYSASPYVLFYRKDILSKVGIDPASIKTWDDFINMGKVLNQNSKGKIKMLSANIENGDMFKMLLNQIGGSYFDKDGKVTAGDSSFQKATIELKKLNDSGIILGAKGNTTQSLVDGTTAFTPAGVDFAYFLSSQDPAQRGDFGIMKFPAFENGGKNSISYDGSSIVAINTDTNKALIKDFLKFAATDKETLLDSFTNYSNFSAYLPVYNLKYFNNNVLYFNGENIWNKFIESGKDAPDFIYTKDFETVDNNVLDTQTKVLKGENIINTLKGMQSSMRINPSK